MIKKLLLTFSFIVLLTATFTEKTYSSEEAGKLVVTEDLANTLNILNNLYKEGIITDEEFSSAKSMLLDPVSASGKKTEKKLTAAERNRLKDADSNKIKAQKKILRDEKLAEKKRIREARLEEMERACTEEYSTSEATLHCTLLKLQDESSKLLNKN